MSNSPEADSSELPMLPPAECVKALGERVDGIHIVDARFCGYPDAVHDLIHSGEASITCDAKREAGKCALNAVFHLEDDVVKTQGITEQ